MNSWYGLGASQAAQMAVAAGTAQAGARTSTPQPPPSPCARMVPGDLARSEVTGLIYVAGPTGQCIPTNWTYATVRNGVCGAFQGINVCISDKSKIPLLPSPTSISEGPKQPEERVGPPVPPSFWDRYGGEIIVGTISAVTSALAVYFAMKLVEKR